MTSSVGRNVGKWVFVAGHCGGIGKSLVSALLKADVKVLGYDKQVSGDARLMSEVMPTGHTHVLINNLLGEVFAAFGAPSAAIICLGSYRRIGFDCYDDAVLEEMLVDNFKAPFWLSQAIVKAMAESGSGRLVLVSSQAGATGGADPGYAAAKAAVTALGKSIARDYADKGIRANIVAPGPVYTSMSSAAMSDERIKYYESQIPISRFAYPEEVAALITFLALGDVDSINGATFDVDGGLVRR